MGRPAKYDQKIIELRRQGLNCREVARQLGISETSVWYCMHKHGLAGKYRVSKYGKEAPVVVVPQYSKNAFSLMVIGNSEVIKVLPTSRRQFDDLLALLQKEGGEIISDERKERFARFR